MNTPDTAPQKAQGTRGKARRTLILVFLTCALPIVAALYFYLVDRPDTTNNYGTILEPQVEVPGTVFKNLAGGDFTMTSLKGKWVLVQTMASDCDAVCQNTLFFQRQARTSKGKDQGRIERVVFVTDNGPLETMLLRQFPDVHFVRAPESELAGWLSLQKGIVGTKGSTEVLGLRDHVFVVDPLGHVMMRFPPNAQLEFDKFRKDISRLLWASNIG